MATRYGGRSFLTHVRLRTPAGHRHSLPRIVDVLHPALRDAYRGDVVGHLERILDLDEGEVEIADERRVERMRVKLKYGPDLVVRVAGVVLDVVTAHHDGVRRRIVQVCATVDVKHNKRLQSWQNKDIRLKIGYNYSYSDFPRLKIILIHTQVQIGWRKK